MVDPDTFLTYLYVIVDEFCKAQLPPERQPGPPASLSRSEVVTLAVFGQWAQFGSERGCYRYAQRRLRGAFPGLPERSQFNRLLRAHYDATVAFGQHLAAALGAGEAPYEALDCSGVPVRNAKRRGPAGWPGWWTSAGAAGWAGTRGSSCSPPSARPGC